MAVWYNEFVPAKAAWLRNLIDEGVIADGVVDERPIQAVQPEDLHGFTQCHFFAGIGVWSHCLRRAGWPDDRPVWTGSCPCGPFSAAGKRGGFNDPRHLWPEWFRLIGVRRPGVLFGEQSAEANAWLDLVSTDLEGAGYAIGAVDIPAAGFGGAHRRQRFGFVADANNAEWWAERAPWNDGEWPQTGRIEGDGHARNGHPPRSMADAENRDRRGGERGAQERTGAPEFGRGRPSGGSSICGMAHPDGWKPWNGLLQRSWEHRQFSAHGEPAEWLLGRDSKWRPVEPGLAPLVNAYPGRLGLLRGFGDAIDAETFTNLIGAYLDVAP